MDHTGEPTCQLSPQRPFCWACSIPDLVWVKFALLDCSVSYNVTEQIVTVFQPVLAAANSQRMATYSRVHYGQRWPPIPPPVEMKHRWRVKPVDMRPEDWHDLVTEISECLTSYHFGGYAG